MKRLLILLAMGLSTGFSAETNAVPNGYLYLTDGSFLGLYVEDEAIELEGASAPLPWKDVVSFTNRNGEIEIQLKEGAAPVVGAAPDTLTVKTRLGVLAIKPSRITHYGPIPEAMLRKNRLFVPPLPTEHSCRDGETIDSIAKWYGISSDTLFKMNPSLTNQGVTSGQTLKLGSKAKRPPSRTR